MEQFIFLYCAFMCLPGPLFSFIITFLCTRGDYKKILKLIVETFLELHLISPLQECNLRLLPSFLNI